MEQHRERARISRVFYGKEDHGIQTCQVYVGEDGWRQAFGGLCLDEKTGPDFVAQLCATFGVRDAERLVGMECFALRAFAWDAIEGLESVATGRRFTITGWRRRFWPDAKSPLDRERERLTERIAHAHRQVAEAERDLQTIASRYVDCEPPRV